ncbi:hypothetical protein [Methylobacterium sp. Leaf93]|uniref:hypothetical protein n=1 Tax=Methylobacterium sp. Leaf93 TaxID=1736249 RepID=UPI000AD7A5E7|nr:hypothetical protein [Methylobacterium sp. Leaf93]
MAAALEIPWPAWMAIAMLGGAKSHPHSGPFVVDVFTAKLLVSAAIVTAVAGFSLLTAGWALLDVYNDFRRGADERASSRTQP